MKRIKIIKITDEEKLINVIDCYNHAINELTKKRDEEIKGYNNAIDNYYTIIASILESKKYTQIIELNIR